MKKVKKVILLMILMMMLSLHASSFAASGSASGNVTLTPSKTEVESGEEFSVTISQECSDGIIGFEAALEYDTNIFELKKVNTVNDWIYLGEGTKLDAMSNTDKKSGEVMQLDFAVKENVAETTSSIKVNQIKLFKTYDDKLEIAEQSVSIKVKGKEGEEKTPVLSKIAITKIPNKIAYTEGESFSPSGMVITATYEDGTSKEVTDYRYSPNSALKTGNNSVTISYTENGTTKTTTQSITVKAASSGSNNSNNNNNNNSNNNNSNNNNNGNNNNSNNNGSQNANSNNSGNIGRNTNAANAGNTSKNTTTDNTTTGTNLPKTGGTSNIVLAVVGVFIIIGFACYFGYRKYKEI